MEAFIRFLIQHNETIVYISGGVICLLSAVVVWWQVFGKKGLNTGDEPQADLTGIEDMLRKILSQTNVAIQNVGGTVIEGSATSASQQALSGASAAPTAQVQALSADMEALKKELESRAHIIEELQSKVTMAKGADASGELLAKIKNLEGKLAEYEIIEDDIADLSNFKEENARLQKELEALKRGGPQLVDQFADALNAKPMSTSSVAVADEAPPAEAPSANVLADVVAQAQAHVNEFGVDLGADTSAPAEDVLDFAAPAAAPQETAAPQQAAAAAKDDIFGEFSGDAPSEEADPLAALGDIDPDKMLDELKDLNADLSMGAEALEEAPDIDKMAQEAENLEKKR